MLLDIYTDKTDKIITVGPLHVACFLDGVSDNNKKLLLSFYMPKAHPAITEPVSIMVAEGIDNHRTPSRKGIKFNATLARKRLD